MSNPVESSFKANSPPSDVDDADADAVMFATASGVMFEHLKRSSMSARTQLTPPLTEATAADLPMRG